MNFRRGFSVLLLCAGLGLSWSGAQNFSQFRIHYHRDLGNYEGWGLHVWGNALGIPATTWGQPLLPNGRTDFGVYWDVPLRPQASRLSFILYLGEFKNTPNDVNIRFAEHGYEVWILQDDPRIYPSRPPLPGDRRAPEPSPAPTAVAPAVSAPAAASEPPEALAAPAAPAPSTPPASPGSTAASPSPAPAAAAPLTSAAAATGPLIDRLSEALTQSQTLLREKESLTAELQTLKTRFESVSQTLADREAALAESRRLLNGAAQPLDLWISIGLGALAFAAVLGAGVLTLAWRRAQKRAAKAVEQAAAAEHGPPAATQDELTGLPNRAAFLQQLHLALPKAKRMKNKLALLFLDLDSFKPINDNLGHEAGDYVLKTIAGRFRDALRESDFIARLGGDEFVVLVDDFVDAAYLGGVAQKLLAAAQKGFVIEGQEVHVSASIGIAAYPDDAADPDSLLRHADAAMYRAKESGKNKFHYFSADLNTHSLQRLALESSLTHALERQELQLVYLPVYRLEDRRISGVEALIRWVHPDMGTLKPLQFLSLAEENSQILDIGRWVLTQACRQARKWVLSRPDLSLTVNISPRELLNPGFVGDLAQILKMTGFPSANLCLDLSEPPLLLKPQDSLAVLHQLRELGVRLWLEDFGQGYSSVTTLAQTPMEGFKLPQGLTTRLADEDSKNLVRALLDLAGALQLKVQAEHIETESQAEALLRLGCPLAQGFLWAKPMTPQEFTQALDAT